MTGNSDAANLAKVTTAIQDATFLREGQITGDSNFTEGLDLVVLPRSSSACLLARLSQPLLPRNVRIG